MLDTTNVTFTLRHLYRALEESQLSPDPSTQVGAVLVSASGHHVISWGCNNFPAGVEPTIARLHCRETKLRLMVHAEQNAIFAAARAGRPTGGATLYTAATDDTGAVWGAIPCFKYGCCHAVIQAGIRRVVTFEPKPTPSAWHADHPMARNMLAEANVELIEVPYVS